MYYHIGFIATCNETSHYGAAMLLEIHVNFIWFQITQLLVINQIVIQPWENNAFCQNNFRAVAFSEHSSIHQTAVIFKNIAFSVAQQLYTGGKTVHCCNAAWVPLYHGTLAKQSTHKNYRNSNLSSFKGTMISFKKKNITLIFWSSCIRFPNVEITGMGHYTWLQFLMLLMTYVP